MILGIGLHLGMTTQQYPYLTSIYISRFIDFASWPARHSLRWNSCLFQFVPYVPYVIVCLSFSQGHRRVTLNACALPGHFYADLLREN